MRRPGPDSVGAYVLPLFGGVLAQEPRDCNQGHPGRSFRYPPLKPRNSCLVESDPPTEFSPRESEGRPTFEYAASNFGERRLSSSSARRRIPRSGWSAGTSFSTLIA